MHKVFDLVWRSKDKALIEKYGLWLLRHDVDRALRVRRLFSSSSVFAALGRRKLTLPPCSTFRTALHRPKAAHPARNARPVRQDGQGRLGRRRPVPRGHGSARARLGASLCTLSLSLRFVADSLSYCAAGRTTARRPRQAVHRPPRRTARRPGGQSASARARSVLPVLSPAALDAEPRTDPESALRPQKPPTPRSPSRPRPRAPTQPRPSSRS